MNGLRDVASIAAAVRRHRSAERGAVEAFQAERLRRLVAHAYARVPYYRRRFDRVGLRPENVHSLADLGALPPTSKLELRATPVSDLVANSCDPARLIEQRTSGSTGQRLTVYRTWLEVRIQHLFRLRAKADAGVRPFDRMVHVGLRHTPHPRDYKLLGRLLDAAGLGRREYVDLFASPEEQARHLRRGGFDLLSGYPGALGRLAGWLLDAGIHDVRPRMVLVGAEVLTPPLRQAIEAAFAAPIADFYGSHEFNLLGWSCPITGDMHLADDALGVEVLADGRPARPGETGEVVVTALHLHAMPLIRYRLGDLAVRGGTSCACGAPWSTLRAVQGRTVDWVRLPDGRMLHPYAITAAAFQDRVMPVRQYQLAQPAPDHVVLRLVVPPGAPTATLADAEIAVRRLLGPTVRFTTELVPEIRPGANGKFRVFDIAPASGAMVAGPAAVA